VVVVRLAVEVVVVEKNAMNSFEANMSWRAGELPTSRREPSRSFRAKLNTNAWRERERERKRARERERETESERERERDRERKREGDRHKESDKDGN